MDTNRYSAEELLKSRLFNKLHPENFSQMSGTMAAVLGYLLDEPLVCPTIKTITVTADGCLLADTDEPRFGCFFGHYKDLIRSWRSLLRVADLETDELMLAESLFAAKIGYFGGMVV